MTNYYVETLEATFSELKACFGEPIRRDYSSQRCDWVTPDFTIYDYKMSDTPLSKVTSWRVSGQTRADVRRAELTLDAYRTLPEFAA